MDGLTCSVCAERPAAVLVVATLSRAAAVKHLEPPTAYCTECAPATRTEDGGVLCLIAVGEVAGG